MWYETLPAFAIIGVCIVIPQFVIYATNKWETGHPHRRNIWMPSMYGNWFRDERLGNGNPYNVQTLDALPDEPIKK